MKKKIRVSSILMVLVPFILCLLAQVIVGIVGGLILQVRFSAEWIQENLVYVLVVTHLVMAGTFGFWYWNVCQKRQESKIKDAITVKSIGAIILYSIGLMILITVAYYFVDLINPEVMDDYAELMQTAGIGTGIWSFIATVFLAPIGEECVFRGLTLFYLEKTGAKFWIANIIQALLFGIMHGNLVQGTYAFVLGLVLGQMMNKYKSVIVTIIFHMIFNLLGSTITGYIPANSVASSLLCAAVGLVLFVLAFIICSRDYTRERRAGKRLSSLAYYQAYTPKKYRVLVHIVFPVVFVLFGTLLLQVEFVQNIMAMIIVGFFIILECIGEYVAFGASCSRAASPINWTKSSYKGIIFFRKVYLWDVVIKLIKYTIVWAVMGLIPILCDNWEMAAFGYLLTVLDSFIAANIVRRIDNVQMMTVVMLPILAVSVLLFILITGVESLMIPVIVILFLSVIAGSVLTYKLSIRAYERSFGDAK